MIVEIDFEILQLKYWGQETIFVKERDDSWDMYTQDGHIIIFCRKMKSEDSAENIIFVERYLTSMNNNITKVIDVQGYEEVEDEGDLYALGDEEYIKEDELNGEDRKL